VNELREQCQRNHRSDDPQRASTRFGEPPERVADDSHGEAGSGLRFVTRESRRRGLREKRVWIPFGQQLERQFPNLGAHQYEFRMNFPELDIGIRAGWGGMKPAFEPKRRFNSGSGQTGSEYRRGASLT
jgi:hypothetical protein